MKLNEELGLPGIGERVGYCVKRGESFNGTVTRIEITKRGTWISFRVAKAWNRRAKTFRVRYPASLMGWTKIKREVRLITYHDKISEEAKPHEKPANARKAGPR